MSKYLYVPGLAMPELVVRQAKTADEFKAKVQSTFSDDYYMKNMVPLVLNKGAMPLDCRQSLQWVSIPKPAKPHHHRSDAVTSLPDPAQLKSQHQGAAKAFKVMGSQATNVLSREAGVQAAPMNMTVGHTLNPCSAPEYLAQPMPSANKTQALAKVGRGDTLYIVGHSSAQGGSLTYKLPALGHILKSEKTPYGCDGFQHCEKRHIDPVTLASLLVNEGLPANTSFDIALVACYSGGLDNDELQTVQCFAQRLAGALGGRGYKCRVYGATGMTFAGDNGNVEVAKIAKLQDDGKIRLNYNSKENQADTRWTPFYRRFFRFYQA
jgi:hypothetical protein